MRRGFKAGYPLADTQSTPLVKACANVNGLDSQIHADSSKVALASGCELPERSCPNRLELYTRHLFTNAKVSGTFDRLPAIHWQAVWRLKVPDTLRHMGTTSWMWPHFSIRCGVRPFTTGSWRTSKCCPSGREDSRLPRSRCRRRSRGCLAARGIEQLYSHQVAALELARAGRDLVVVTGTASGKTLCYNLPILEDGAGRSRRAGAVPVSDQGPGAGPAQGPAGAACRPMREIASEIMPGVYDGDTPTAQRRRIQGRGATWCCRIPTCCTPRSCRIIRSGAGSSATCATSCIDEIHTYRGILGANVACVLRRLARVCEHYGSRPVFLAASATIANPGELAGKLIGRDVAVVDDDGRRAGRKYFRALESDAAGQRSPGARAAPTDDAVSLMVEAMRRRRPGAGLHAHAAGGRAGSPLRQRTARQRGTRRWPTRCGPIAAATCRTSGARSKQQLFAGQLRGVAATNALELGVDIGSLDVALLAGYPGTIASTWQQAGRSGRRHDESLAVLLAGNDPVDQYLLRHPDYFFAQSPEHAVVDPENPYVLANHLQVGGVRAAAGRSATSSGSARWRCRSPKCCATRAS